MDSLLKKAGMQGKTAGGGVKAWRADFAAGAFVLPVLTGI